MRVLALVQGTYGKRMVEVWRERGPEGWRVEALRLPPRLPPLIDEPADFLPPEIPPADLLVSLGEHPGVLELVPEVVGRCGARAAVLPVDNRQWVPPGLVGQVRGELERRGLSVVVPVTFCALREEGLEDPFLREFAQHFGAPQLELRLEEGRIAQALVRRSAPCGSTFFVAEGLWGVSPEEAEQRAGLLHHNYPCLASMEMDWEFNDTLMHVAGNLSREAVRRALGEAR